MFLSRRSILATFLLSFPSVATAICYEIGQVGTACFDPTNPKVAVCTMDYFGVAGRSFGACCPTSEPDPPTTYETGATCTFDNANAAGTSAENPTNSSAIPPVPPVPAVPAVPTCYEGGVVGAKCYDPTHPREGSCTVTYPYTPPRTFLACCTRETIVPSVAEATAVCTLPASAPVSGAWAVAVLAAVATTVAAAF